MTIFVVDANVAAKWCLPPAGEAYVPQALHLLEAYGRGEVGLLAPDFLFAEFGNVLWKAVRRERIPASAVGPAITLLESLRIPTVSSSGLLTAALAIALKHDRSVYDSLYVALASQSGAQMITADARLANALAGHLPVKWLGTY